MYLISAGVIELCYMGMKVWRSAVVKIKAGRAENLGKVSRARFYDRFFIIHISLGKYGIMEVATQSAEALKRQIATTEEELKRLKEQLAVVEAQSSIEKAVDGFELGAGPVTTGKWPLELEEYKRYGRQMIVPNIGIQGGVPRSYFKIRLADRNPGQLRLKAASVLIVGAGGLGCPAAAYVAGAGVGTLGIVDGDTVETSNLHRQILHNMAKVGMKKVDSAVELLTSYRTLYPFLPRS
jgi:adenylyltransferase and sulfurtransferase